MISKGNSIDQVFIMDWNLTTDSGLNIKFYKKDNISDVDFTSAYLSLIFSTPLYL